jgi:capsular polysaccharide biosynthesis protein
MTDTESFYVNHLKVIDWPTIDTSGQVLAKEYLPPSYAIDILRSNLRLTRGQSKYVVWLSRKHVSVKNNRNIQNEDLVLENLVKTCPGYEVLNFIPENYSIEQTKDIFSQAKIVVGVHGGAFSNIVYCSGDTSVIEFTMLEEYYRYYFKYLSDLCKLKYYEIQLNNPNLFTIPFILPDNALDNLQNIIKNILL